MQRDYVILLHVLLAFWIPTQGFLFVRRSLAFYRKGHEPITFCNPKEESERNLTLATKLHQKAEALRDEAEALKLELQNAKQEKLNKEVARVEAWIEHLLIKQTVDKNTELLYSVEEVMPLLRDGRFSQEQVQKMFDRICERGPPQSRSKCSPILALLVDAAGKLDELDREENPNKRWSGVVERKLRKKLFAMDWNIDLEAENKE
ncbi:predicted protein [Phaeodactylum tricornutum CCAP 1055/1]|jgi:hypothetical protein|uniref:Uncharacterized protein n=1 Tax=Phaeodactylum tricornutum (strain CCAP 1055/1) TaxID=556484 RepID=B7FXT3_PHATC|nr:predicted protein [Phaeodactylum tricornutum CCAP 1055/1]EEC48807.1 predicted protein [Phaeodactylum tricornutum CCAP 1055/1]|eukprot:XP_002179821.1 predicted protein [Phaeodactylum tricornutum CCAP 1055/1]